MNKYFAGAIVLGIVGMAGCASTAETEAYTQARAGKDAGKETLVGSRLVKPTTDRTVNSVGGVEYSELNQHKGMANTVGAKSN